MRYFFIIPALFLLTACGQKSSLYLPSEPKEEAATNEFRHPQLGAIQDRQEQ